MCPCTDLSPGVGRFMQVGYLIAGCFQGLYISPICSHYQFQGSNFQEFCYRQHKCNTFEVFQGFNFIFHEFGLYHKILEV